MMLNDGRLESAGTLAGGARTAPTLQGAPAPVAGTSVVRVHLRVPLWPFVLLAVVLIGLFLLTLALGSVQIPLDQIVRMLGGGEADRAAWTNIVLKFRLPRALTALLAGGALGVAGLMMQTFFRNPLASPDVLGIHAGASLGVALVVLTVGSAGGEMLAGIGLAGDVSLAAAASLGAGLTIALVLLIARRAQNSATLLLFGLMIGQFTFAFVSLLLYFSVPERIQAYVNWGFGSFSGVNWTQMPILALAVTGGLLLAGFLDLPYVGYIAGVTVTDGKCVARKEFPGGLIAEMEVQLPAVLGIQAPDEPPRYIAVSKVRQAMKTATIEEFAATGLDRGGGPTVTRMFQPESGERATMLEGDEEAIATRLVDIFRELGVL